MGGKDYDPTRTVRSLVIGGLSSIPSYNWYVECDQVFCSVVALSPRPTHALANHKTRFVWLSHSFNYSSRILSLVTKVVVNQICFTPVFNTYFFGMQALLAGDNAAQIWERVKKTVPVSVVNSCKLWPAVTAFMFAFVPLEYRSLFSGFIAVGWQTYLSFLNRMAEEGAKPKSVTEQERLDTPRIEKIVA